MAQVRLSLNRSQTVARMINFGSCKPGLALACSTVAEMLQALKIQNDKLTVRPLLDQALAFEIDKRVFQGLHLKAKQVRDNATFQRVRDNGCISSFVHILAGHATKERGQRLDRRGGIAIQNGCFAPFKISA